MENLLGRWSRLAPLTGIVFAVLGVVAFASGQGVTPTDGPGLLAFFATHGTASQVSDLLWTFSFVFFVFFAGSLSGYLRRSPAAEGLSHIVLAGAAIMTVGAIAYFNYDFALAASLTNLAPAAAQALNVLATQLALPFGAGGLVFGIASGLAILRGAALPKWLGWFALVGGLAMAVLWLLGIFFIFIWTAIVSVLIWKRSGLAPQPLAATTATSPSATPDKP